MKRPIIFIIALLMMSTVLAFVLFYPQRDQRFVAVLENWRHLRCTPLKEGEGNKSTKHLYFGAKNLMVDFGWLTSGDDSKDIGFRLDSSQDFFTDGEITIYECHPSIVSKFLVEYSENLDAIVDELKPFLFKSQAKNFRSTVNFVYDPIEPEQIEKDEKGNVRVVLPIYWGDIGTLIKGNTSNRVRLLVPGKKKAVATIFLRDAQGLGLSDELAISRMTREESSFCIEGKDICLRNTLHISNSSNIPVFSISGKPCILVFIPSHTEFNLILNDQTEFEKKQKNKALIILMEEFSVHIKPVIEKFPSFVSFSTDDEKFRVEFPLSKISFSGALGKVKKSLDEYAIDPMDTFSVEGDFTINSDEYPKLKIAGKSDHFSINETVIRSSIWSSIDTSIKAAIIGAFFVFLFGSCYEFTKALIQKNRSSK